MQKCSPVWVGLRRVRTLRNKNSKLKTVCKLVYRDLLLTVYFVSFRILLCFMFLPFFQRHEYI